MIDLDAMMAEINAERDAALARQEADPAFQARAAAKRAAEHARNVRAGVITEDGEPGPNALADEDDEDDEA